MSDALRQFDIAEANLSKLERIENEIASLIPSDFSFGQNITHEEKCRSFQAIIENLPLVDGWKPSASHMTVNDIVQSRIDAQDIGEMSAIVSIEEEIERPGSELRNYRFKLNGKRKKLIRDLISNLIDDFDGTLTAIEKSIDLNAPQNSSMEGNEWLKLTNIAEQIDTLLGSSVQRPERWPYLHRHLGFKMLGDFNDIKNFDWPPIKKYLHDNIYGDDEPIPSEVADLSDLVQQKPLGNVTRKLKWETLTPEDFERLVFSLISSEFGYENPQWLTKTNAPDRGRDLSVDRVIKDSLTGVIRLRVIIQCKHWLKNSISIQEIQTLKEQMKLWEPPRVDVYIIATSGRFTSDAITLIEKNNQSDNALRIEMWSDSHLEMLLASRPALIEEFKLR